MHSVNPRSTASSSRLSLILLLTLSILRTDNSIGSAPSRPGSKFETLLSKTLTDRWMRGTRNRAGHDARLPSKYWQSANGPANADVWSLALDEANGFVYVGTYLQGVYRSLDNGANWEHLDSNLTNKDVLALLALPNGNVFAGTYDGVFRLTKNSVSWTHLTTGMASTVVSAFAVLPNSTGGASLFAGTDNGVYVSSDSGGHWTASSAGLPSYPVYVFSVHFSPSGKPTLYAGMNVSGISASTDSGRSWTATGLTNTDVRSLTASRADSTGSFSFFAGTDDGMFLSTDAGATWNSIDSGLSNVDVWAVAAGYNRAGGMSILAGTNGDGIFLSTNGGAVWIPGDGGLPNGYISAMAIDSNGRVYCGTWGEGVFTASQPMETTLTVNAGWNLLSIPYDPVIDSVNIALPLFISGPWLYPDSVYRPSVLLDAGVGFWLECGAAETSLVVVSSTPVETVNVHQGWNIIGCGSAPVFTGSVLGDTAGIVTSQYFGYSNGYYPADTMQPGQGYWVRVNKTARLILNAGLGGFAKSLIGFRVHVVASNDMPPPPPGGTFPHNPRAPVTFSLGQAFPNPFNPTVTIEYELPVSSRVSVVVYNMLGERIAILMNEIQGPGVQSVRWNGANQPSGVYFYRLEATPASGLGDAFVQTRKMLLLK